MNSHRSSVLFLPIALSLLLFALLLVGCGDDPTGSQVIDDGIARVAFEGNFDGEEMVLQRITDPRTGLALDLVAKDVRYLDTALIRIEVDVALRNASNTPVFGPVMVFLGSFVPEGVGVENSDDPLVDGAMARIPFDGRPYPHYFEYSEAELGDDELMLGPGETSGTRTWRFVLPELAGFSFGSEAWVGTQPTGARIAGTVFLDSDRDGSFDPDEPVHPFGGAGNDAVAVRLPRGVTVVARVDEAGRWSIPANAPGIYEAHYLPPPTLFAPICFTTADPLRVVLGTGPDGNLVSFLHADIGIDPENCFGPPPSGSRVQLTQSPPDSIATDAFQLISAQIVNRRVDPAGNRILGLEIRVGYSGCSPDHPLALFAGADFMESSPPQTWLRISHDDRGELCDAYFEDSRVFDLSPLRNRFFELYGSYGPMVLVLTTPDGQQLRFELP